jgi:hypothetical protein
MSRERKYSQKMSMDFRKAPKSKKGSPVKTPYKKKIRG